jgi:4-amino-4-deoxy-L-arabinose transferase-like glycosyltransferase
VSNRFPIPERSVTIPTDRKMDPAPPAWAARAAWALAAVNLARAVAALVRTWDLLWPHPVLAIDGPSYLRGAEELQSIPFWRMTDTYHSPGYQALLAVFYWLGGGTPLGAAHVSKVVSLGLFAASIFLVYGLARRLAGRTAALLAVVIFSSSTSWITYANMIQYEVLVGFLLLEAVTAVSTRRAGAALFFAAWIQVRYLPLLLVPPAATGRRGWRVTLLALVPLLLWIAVRGGELAPGSEQRFRIANNPNATGAAFPYPPVAEPFGWAFVVHRPAQLAALAGRRFLYLTGITTDVWTLPPGGEPGAFSPVALGWTLLFFAALAITIGNAARAGRLREWSALLLVLAGVFAPPLVIFASGRFLVPALPLAAIVLANGLALAAVRVRSAVNRRSLGSPSR